METFSNATHQNPFSPEKLPNVDRDASYKLMNELNKLHDKLKEQFTSKPRENFSFHPHEDPKRTLEYKDYGGDGPKYITETNKKSDGTETLLSYLIDSPTHPGSLLRACTILYRTTADDQIREFILDPSQFLTKAFESFNNHQVNSFDEDGLHVETRERVEWSIAWRNFFLLLTADQTFSNALNKGKFLRTNHLTKEHDPLTMDPEAVLNNLENIWNSAYSSKFIKKTFPRNKAPTNLGPPPPEWIISYQEINRLLQFIINKLVEDVHLLDQYQFPDKSHPYR